MKTNSSSSTTVAASCSNSPVEISTRISSAVKPIATTGVPRLGSTRPSTGGSSPSRAIPNVSREAMMEVSSAPLATAISAITENSSGGRPPGARRTTSSSGPSEPASTSVGTAIVTVSPTRQYTAPAMSSPANSTRG